MDTTGWICFVLVAIGVIGGAVFPATYRAWRTSRAQFRAMQAEVDARKAERTRRFDVLRTIALAQVDTNGSPFIVNNHVGVYGLRVTITTLHGHWLSEAVERCDGIYTVKHERTDERWY